ncbi:hypothetical protein AX16_009309 [Volvariella volvacea WC 439]|nr:hypothetical protein AX16_009309 [Volvariella volvacea WC 439]
MASKIAFIIGAGTNIGKAVAEYFKTNGYAVAVGSRNPNNDTAKAEGYLPVTVDASKSDSIQEAFTFVKANLGSPNVVIFNAADLRIPPTPTDPLSLPYSAVEETAAVGLGVFSAAQAAVAGFRASQDQSASKAFIFTGNLLPFLPGTSPQFITLDIQKRIASRLINHFSDAFKAEGFRFHYASLVSPAGELPGMEAFGRSGPTHARVYWDLVNSQAANDWDYRFDLDGNKVERK